MAINVALACGVALFNIIILMRNGISAKLALLAALMLLPVLIGGEYIARWGDWVLIDRYAWLETEFRSFYDNPNENVGAGYAISGCLLILCFACWRFSSLAPFETLLKERPPAVLRIALATTQTGVAAGAALCLILTAWAYWHLVQPLPSFPAPPEPNAYPRIVALGEKLRDVQIPNEQKSSAEEFSQFVVKYEPLIDEARELVKLPCRVRSDWWSQERYGAYYDVAAVGNLLCAAAEAAELEGRSQDAAQLGLLAIQLGHRGALGGRERDWILGSVMNEVGGKYLARNRQSLTAAQCREIIAKLMEIDRQREPANLIQSRSKAFERIRGGWRVTLFQCLRQLRWNDADDETTYSIFQPRRDAVDRLIIVELAVRTYQAEHDSLPESLNDLVPQYLTIIPNDPYSGESLVYRPSGKDFLLYSVGPNQSDEGGTFPDSWAVTVDYQGDLSLENFWKRPSNNPTP